MLCLGGVTPLEKSKELKASIAVLKTVPRPRLKQRLEEWSQRLGKVQGTHLKRHRERLGRLIADLATVEQMEHDESALEGSGEQAVVGQQLSRAMSASKRRKMAFAAATDRASAVKCNEIRLQAGLCLSDSIRDASSTLWSTPLHELVVFDDVATLQKALQPEARSLLHAALNEPHRFLHLDPEKPDQVPDICLLYRELEKRGRLINLQEWFEVFKACPFPERPTTLELRFRFVRAVSELEMLGYLKKTNRRRGHVQANIHV